MPTTHRFSRKGITGLNREESSSIVRLPIPIVAIAKRIAAGTLRFGDVSKFFSVAARRSTTVPLVAAKVAAGFPSPADDYLDRPLDFNELLIANAAATFAVRIAGESMTGAGLFPGDIAVVDRSMSPTNGCVVLALVDGEFTIKRYRVRAGAVVLQAENKAFKDLIVPEEASFEVWGVVRHAIRMF